MENVLIVGASGLTGKLVVEKLMNYPDYKPIAMIRDKSQKVKFDRMGVTTVIADLEEKTDHALNGVDKVIFAAGSGSSTGTDKTYAIDRDGAIKLIDQAKKAGIKKLVMLSAMGVDNPDQGEGQMKDYLRAKKEADEHLMNSGLSYSIVRPGGLVNDKGNGKIQAAPSLNMKGNIARDDVADVLIEALDNQHTQNQTFEILSGGKKVEQALADLA